MKINAIKLIFLCFLIEVFIWHSSNCTNLDSSSDFPDEDEMRFSQLSTNELRKSLKFNNQASVCSITYKMFIYVIKEKDRAETMPKEMKLNINLSSEGVNVMRNDMAIKTIPFTE